MLLSVFNPSVWAYGIENEIVIPIGTEPGRVRSSDGIEVINEPIEYKTRLSAPQVAKIASGKWACFFTGNSSFVRMLSAMRRDHKARNRRRVSVDGPFIWWSGQGQDSDVHKQLSYESRTLINIGNGPRNLSPKWQFLVGQSRIFRINSDPRSFKMSDSAFSNFGLSTDGSPLQAGKESINSSDYEQANVDQHLWRVPGFLAGVVLFLGGFILIGYGAYCFEDLNLKVRGFLSLAAGILLYVLGGTLMFIGPYLL